MKNIIFDTNSFELPMCKMAGKEISDMDSNNEKFEVLHEEFAKANSRNGSTAVTIFAKYENKHILFGKDIDSIEYEGYVIPDEYLMDSVKYFDRKTIKKIDGVENMCQFYDWLEEELF